MNICERVVTENGKVEYCKNIALYRSPPGFYTGRIINVCNKHKMDLENVHNSKGVAAQFVRLK